MDTEFKVQFKGITLSDSERERIGRAIREATLRELAHLEVAPDKLRIEMGSLVQGIVIRSEL
jgi:hypothetical protein